MESSVATVMLSGQRVNTNSSLSRRLRKEDL